MLMHAPSTHKGGSRQVSPLEGGHDPNGMLERDAARMIIAAILTASRNMHAREAVQHLTQAVLQASGGQLRDDAMALCLDWHGGPRATQRGPSISQL